MVEARKAKLIGNAGTYAILPGLAMVLDIKGFQLLKLLWLMHASYDSRHQLNSMRDTEAT